MSREPTISRREFAALSIAAGVAVATRVSAADVGSIVEEDVQIVMAGAICDAALVHPNQASWPGVILYTDVFGLRPSMRDMAKRLAGEGFSVLVPNLFYRSSKPPGLSTDLDFTNPADRAKIDQLRKPLTRDAVAQDATAYVEFLDSRACVRRKAKLGVFGYCMGGPMTLQAAAANPDRIGAAASFHGGGLVTDHPDSPHLLLPKIRARCYLAVAMNDDARQPQAKHTLAEGFRGANLPAKIEVYDGCVHGWCVPDIPAVDGKPPIYNPAQAQRAWGELLSLFKWAQA